MFTIDTDNYKITIVKKDTARLNLTLDNHVLQAGDTVTFTIAREKESQEPLVQKVITTFVNGIATIILNQQDTDLDKGTYFYDIQVDTADGRTDTVIGPAKFKIVEGVTF